MTRTDVMASSRPQTPAAPMSRRSSTVRALVALPIVLLMALALLAPGTAVAAEETSPYSQTPTTPAPTTTPTTPATTPTTGTSPSKEEGTPTTSTPKETTPTTSSSPAKEAVAKTLPFTGFDLRWSFGIGLVLMGAGFSIVMMQRRRREGGH
jgi:cytoskeletal protein RodZ